MKQIFLLLALLLMVAPAYAGKSPNADCLSCHQNLLGIEAGTGTTLKGTSHHVQGTAISGKHCYACHWEATAEGNVDKRYHAGNAKTAKGQVHLVVWQNGKRPTAYRDDTVVIFQPGKIATSEERAEVTKVTSHCLGCHSDAGNATRPFAGDHNEPRAYAWDGQSIAARYADKGTTTWGKYSTATTNKKQRIVKAFSAHGNAAANTGGWDKARGYDGDMPITRGGANAKNVECFDCHNSHGSSVPGVTSSYRTTNGTYNGGLLKETVAGKAGYRTTYTPSVNSYKQAPNPFNAGAGLCFDCHETSAAGATPWGYSTTFGATQPIMGYKDSHGFGPGIKGSSSRFANRQSRETVTSSHFKAGQPLAHSIQGDIKGLCTPCHDPHGISPTLGRQMAYAVPLLKGTWLTSPYREDGPPTGPATKATYDARESDFNEVNRSAGANFGKGTSSAARDDFNAVNRDAGANFGKGDSGTPRKDYNEVNRNAGANFGKGASSAPRDDFNAVNRDAGANFGKGDSGAPRQDYNEVNRAAGANFGKGASSTPRDDFNAVNRDAGANFGKGDSGAPRKDYNEVNRNAGANFGKGASSASRDDFNAVNRDAGANFGKGDSGAPRQDYNEVNRSASANFGKGTSSAPRDDFNAVNRDAGANFGKGDSGAPRQDYNEVNRSAGANFGKGASSAPRDDFNAVNRDAGANFGKGDSGTPRKDYNEVNRNAGANFGKGASSAPRDDFNAVNRDAGANFGKGDSGSPREGDYNATNRTAGNNLGRGSSAVPRDLDANAVNRDMGSNFGKGNSGAPREPMQGMKYHVDQNTFGGKNRISEDVGTFAGLCLKCHSKESFAGNSKSALVHRAVKGWGNNQEHSFPCSKCHQPHNSGLPRLMQTNCFEQGPSGLRESSGLPWLPYKKGETVNDSKTTQTAPAKDKGKTKIVGCHVRQFGKSTGMGQGGQDGIQWKEKSPW